MPTVTTTIGIASTAAAAIADAARSVAAAANAGELPGGLESTRWLQCWIVGMFLPIRMG